MGQNKKLNLNQLRWNCSECHHATLHAINRKKKVTSNVTVDCLVLNLDLIQIQIHSNPLFVPTEQLKMHLMDVISPSAICDKGNSFNHSLILNTQLVWRSWEIRKQSEGVSCSYEPKIKHLSSAIDHSVGCRMERCTFPRNFRLGGVGVAVMMRMFYSWSTESTLVFSIIWGDGSSSRKK